MNIDQFTHLVLLKKSGTKIKELSDMVKLNIESFEKAYKTWLIKKDPEVLKQLEARSMMIARHIYDYFVEEDPDDTTDIDAMADAIKDSKIPDDATPPNTTVNPPAQTAPQSPPPPEKPLSNDEKALKTLLEEGIVSGITLSLLKEKGFNTGISSPLGRRGCRVGDYELIRESADSYKLVKHG